MKLETDILAACSFSLVVSLLELRSQAQIRSPESGATMLNIHLDNTVDHLEVEVKSIFNLQPEKGGPKEIGKLQFVARLWQHGATEEQMAYSHVYANPEKDIVFDMDPEREPAKLVVQKQSVESGWLVVEVHRLSRLPGKKSHLLGEVVAFVEEVKDVDGTDEAEQGGRIEGVAGSFQTMIFPHVSEEGEIGEELWRRSDQIAKRFLNRYDY